MLRTMSVIAIAFIGAAGQALAFDASQTLEQSVLRPTIRVDADDGPGTGTIIHVAAQGEHCSTAAVEIRPLCETGALALTNYHVVAKQLPGKQKTAKGKQKEKLAGFSIDVTLFTYTGPYASDILANEHKAHIVAWDAERDLALIHVPTAPPESTVRALLASRNAEPRRGALAWRASCPAGYEPIITEGRFWSVDLRKTPKEARLIATPALTEGSSGGGVYQRTLDRFEMIAVSALGGETISKKFEIEHVSLSIPIMVVHDFLAAKGFHFVTANP